MRSGVLVLPALLVLLMPAHAANYVVSTHSDSGPGSLRQAILDANARGGGNITFSNVSGTIALQSGLPVLTANIIVSGPGSAELTITNSHDNTFSILTNSAANTAAVTGLRINATVDNYGNLTLQDVFVGNQFNPGTPGLHNSGTMTLSRCIFSGNGVPSSADGIMNDGTMNLDHCAITNNRGGGDVFNYGNLTMDNCVVSGHTWFTSSSGGLVNEGGGFLVLRNCSISNNWSIYGGGIWNGGSLAVTNCTINGNSVFYSEPGELGGGLYNVGYAVLQNTTISGNSAMGDGGGIWNGGSVRLLNCTVTSNTVSMQDYQHRGTGGGVWNSTANSAVFQSENSIIAGNAYSTNRTLIPDDIHGYFESFGHNIILSSNGWTKVGDNTTDLIGVDPLLGPLQDNGGPTWTHALTQGSPAIDAGDPSGAPVEDQRGVARPQGSGIDIGAFEFVYHMNAVFASIEVQSSTNVFLKAFGSPFTSYILQVSQDFGSWEGIDTATSSSNGTLQFTKPMAYPKAFYRLQSQTP